MHLKVVTICILLFTLSVQVNYIQLVNSSINSWANVEVVSFDGTHIYFSLKIFVKGNHINERMWVRVEPPSSDSVYVEVRRGICDIVYNEETNLTVFSYSYSYEQTQYTSKPKFWGYLLFPWDEHRLVLFIYSSFNLTIDAHPWNCELPFQNYIGKFQVTHSPTNEDPFRYKLVLEIKHSSGFIWAVAFFLYTIVGGTLALTIVLIVITILAIKRNLKNKLQNVITVSSAIIFFIPAFEIAFNNVRSPLPLVFSDFLMILAFIFNVATILAAVYKLY